MKTVRSLFGIVISIFFVMSFITQAWSLEQGAEKQKQKVIPVPATEGLKEPMKMLPDLVVEGVQISDFLSLGDQRRERVSIKNIGVGSIPPGTVFYVRVQIYGPGNSEIFNKDFELLEYAQYGFLSGQTRTFSFESPITLGTGGVCNCLQKITVDLYNQVKESNENNNIYIIDSYLH